MQYSGIHKKFIISEKELEKAYENLKRAMKKAREIANVPLQKRKSEGMLEDIDHLERAIIEDGKSIGINFGADWGADIDLSE
jgi:hypothetical protein